MLKYLEKCIPRDIGYIRFMTATKNQNMQTAGRSAGYYYAYMEPNSSEWLTMAKSVSYLNLKDREMQLAREAETEKAVLRDSKRAKKQDEMHMFMT